MPEEIDDVAAVIATGRSDYPNQINNVLAFPGVFRGALDVRAREITQEMELAAAEALAAVDRRRRALGRLHRPERLRPARRAGRRAGGRRGGGALGRRAALAVEGSPELAEIPCLRREARRCGRSGSSRREPGLVLDETPVPTIGDDDVLVRVEAASLCGTDLHIFHWDDWAAAPHPAAADARPRVRRHGRRGRPQRAPRRGRRLRLGREPRHLRHVLPLPHGAGAHVRADADPRRRPRRRLRRVRRRARVGDLAQRPLEASAGDRDAPGAVRERGLRHEPARPRRADGRDPRLRPGRAVQHRDRARLRSRARARLGSRRVPARARADDGRHRRRQRRRRRRRPGLVPRAERGRAPRRRLRDVRRAERDRRRVPDRPQRRDTSSCSGSRRARSRSTSRSR